MATLIKRYANRKLYNTATSRYITLKGIAKLLDEGEEVRVIDKETGEDITQVALSQILVGSQRAKEDPSETLITQILSRGSDALYGAIKKSVDDATDGLEDFQDRFRHFVNQSESIARGGRGFAWEDRRAGERRSPFAPSDAAPEGETEAREGEDARRDDEAGGRGAWGRLGGFPDIREAIQTAVGNALDRDGFGDFPRKRDFDALNQNLSRVAEAIDRLEAALRERDEPTD